MSLPNVIHPIVETHHSSLQVNLMVGLKEKSGDHWDSSSGDHECYKKHLFNWISEIFDLLVEIGVKSQEHQSL